VAVPATFGPFSRDSASPAELKERLAADRDGRPYLLYRDEQGSQRIFQLSEERESATVGRSPESDVCLSWDAHVSSTHAELRRLGGDWTIVDDNLSRNGTLLNGERLHGRARLRSGDVVQCGITAIGFRAPPLEIARTAPPDAQIPSIELSPAQRRVLVALCRPFTSDNPFPRPATNQEIADRLVVTVPAVKTQLRALFERFDVEDLPNNQKRARLVELALSSGTVSPRELTS
jgi:pSer/pThr/pTyr-binding forkhead associated (FHA) protein